MAKATQFLGQAPFSARPPSLAAPYDH